MDTETDRASSSWAQKPPSAAAHFARCELQSFSAIRNKLKIIWWTIRYLMAQEPLYSLIEAVLVHIYFRCTGFECEYTGKKSIAAKEVNLCQLQALLILVVF